MDREQRGLSRDALSQEEGKGKGILMDGGRKDKI